MTTEESQNTQLAVIPSLSAEHTEQLRAAKQSLEMQSFATRISQLIGTPVERAMEALPVKIKNSVGDLTAAALHKALDAAILTLGKPSGRNRNLWHKTSVAVSGAFGGAFGLPALTVELPVSTTLILRSIADIARSEGEDLSQKEAQLACMQVFALGGPGSADDGAETGYFGVRAALGKLVADSSRQLAAGAATPTVLNKFVAQIASRFSTPVAQKIAVQAVPLVGAIGGATVNTLFIDHFQTVARGHFTVRRLERIYGRQAVLDTYRQLTRSADESLN